MGLANERWAISERASSALVSVIVPTFDRAALVSASVASALAQTMRDLEVIVVDDGSTDDTGEVLGRIDDERLRVIPTSHTGSAARTRNVGIGEARGRYIAFLDSDDVWLADKLERQLAALDAAPECRWSYTLYDHIDEHGAWMAPLKGGVSAAESGWLLERMVREEVLAILPSIVAESSLVRELGGFDETPETCEDLDLCLRLAASSQGCVVDAPLTRVRHHPGRSTFGRPEVRRWRVRVLDKLARANPDPALRRACRRECARELVDLACVYEGQRRRGATLRALGSALRYRPWDARLWRVFVGTLARLSTFTVIE